MYESNKILIAGVGGQGVVYLTKLIVEAALLADIPVATSEIHGLAQRSGSVMAGITFGENTHGFIEKAGADFLIALETLEAQRCLPFLNKNSRAVIDNKRISPFSVKVNETSYPDATSFLDYLRGNIEQVIFISDFNEELHPILRNIHALGTATLLDGFPIPYDYIEKATENAAKTGYEEKSVRALRLGRTVH